MANIKARWSFELITTCANCLNTINLDDVNYYSYVSDLGLEVCEQDTINSTNIEVECPHCNNQFLVDCEY